MWNPFRRQPLLPLEDREFIVTCYQWFFDHFGEDAFDRHTRLVLPTRDFFPTEESWQDDMAYHLFRCVREHAGMTQWPCRLVPQKNDPNPLVSPTLAIQNLEPGPAGTFSFRGQKNVVISYNPALVARPADLIATFAHELAHYFMASAGTPPPGGWENEEPATDVGAVFLGFGIFSANAAFHFQQFTDLESQGWKTSALGYLTEKQFAYALAVFLELKQIPYQQVKKYCRTNIKSYLKQAIKDLREDPVAGALKSRENFKKE